MSTKILLATGIFYPDVGGPAIHVRKIAERLVVEGFEPVVIAYGDDTGEQQFSFRVKRVSRKYPKILQWIFYFFLALKESVNAKVVYAFDPTAAGLPACLAAWIFNRPFLIRIGGDPIWEREVEAGRRFMDLNRYYKEGLYLKDKPLLFRMIRSMLAHTDALTVYNQMFKDFYSTYFGMSKDKIYTVKNPVFVREKMSDVLPEQPTILFAGRFVAYKNLLMVMEVFNRIWHTMPNLKLLLIGKGPDGEELKKLSEEFAAKDAIEFREAVPQEKLFEEIQKSFICIGPALSEFNPNFILEALSFGKLVMLSKGNGLSVDLPEEFLFDPYSADELELKLRTFLMQEGYAWAVHEIQSIPLNQSWEDVTDFHFNLIKKYI